MIDKKSNLELELEELFDIKKAKEQNEKKLAEETMEAKKEIRLLTHMFREGVPDVTIPLGDNEFLKWDAKNQNLLFVQNEVVQIIDACSPQTMIRIRHHLTLLVKQAKNFYLNDKNEMGN
jgi:hypothetical protein